MTKNEFLKHLRLKLGALQPQDINSVISYYDELISGAIEEGIGEERAVARLGPLPDIVLQCIDEYFVPAETTLEAPVTANRQEITERVSLNFPATRGAKKANFEPDKTFSLSLSLRSTSVIIEQAPVSKVNISYYNDYRHQYYFFRQADVLGIEEGHYNILNFFINIAFFVLAGIAVWIIGSLLKTQLPYLISFLIVLPFYLLHLGYLIFKLRCGQGKLRIQIPPYVKFENLLILSRNGYTKLRSLKLESAQINNSNGSTKIFNSEADNWNIEIKNGNVAYENLYFSSALSSKTFTAFSKNGCIKISGLSADKVDLQSRNGKISCNNVLGNNSIQLSTKNGIIKQDQVTTPALTAYCRNGNIRLNQVDSTNLSLVTKNGVVKANIISSKHIVAKTDNGNIHLNEINGQEKDYHVQVALHSQAIHINNAKKHIFRNISENVTDDKTILATTKNGRIKMTFSQDKFINNRQF